MSNSMLLLKQSPYHASGPRGRQASAEDERTVRSPLRATSFDCFRLLPAQRLLLNADKAVAFGSRALDTLIASVERAGEFISKHELMAPVWPKIFVHPGNLTAHIAALWRALGDGRDGNRFIVSSRIRLSIVAAITTPVDPQSPVKCAAQLNASAGFLSI